MSKIVDNTNFGEKLIVLWLWFFLAELHFILIIFIKLERIESGISLILKKEKKNELNFDYIILLSLKRKNEMCSIELDSFTWKALKDENLESSTVLK